MRGEESRGEERRVGDRRGKPGFAAEKREEERIREERRIP